MLHGLYAFHRTATEDELNRVTEHPGDVLEKHYKKQFLCH